MAEEAEEEADLEGLCFGFDFECCTGDLAGRCESLSDGLNKLLENCKGDSEPGLFTNAVAVLFISN